MLFEQVREYRPKMAALTAGEVAIPDDLQFCDWYFGEDALSTIASTAPCDDVLVSVVGMVGLRSVLAARAAGKRVLLANKEALVAGGQLVMDACVSTTDDPVLIPVDSEHSAIYQVLLASKGNPYERIILTASGGPFLTWTHAQMQTAKLSDALKHPNWDMGQKITIDSATMFNKALEMIEAKWLFDSTPNQIEVLVHPQSIIHSMVSFQDGATLAQLGVPDMRAPIAFAMAFPDRITNGTPPLRLEQLAGLSFEAPDLPAFAIRLAYDCLRAGGAACCVLNAANEVAVDAFVKGIIGFTDIAKVVEQVLQGIGHLSADTLDDVLHADKQARARAQAFIHT